jgi:endo-1,4-beta-xylanase
MKYSLVLLLTILFLTGTELFSQIPAITDMDDSFIPEYEIKPVEDIGLKSLSIEKTDGNPLAQGLSKFLGCAFSSGNKSGFENYWNQLVPENAGKWGSAEPSRDFFSWGSLDEAYNFAVKNGFPYRHHVLVWGNQQPAWIETLPESEQIDEIKEWFQAVANRFPDINFLEVVNEPLHDPPNQPGNGGGNYIQALGGSGTTGYDWILRAFRLAHYYFPETTKLMINEYGLTDNSNNVKNYIKIIELLKKEKLIDAVGVQGHAFNTTVSASTIKGNLDLLAQVGLPIYITEMDIDGATDEQQLASYKRIFPVFWEHPAVQGITLWGYKPGMWRTEQKAYLVNADGSERPAMTWLREYLQSFLSLEEIEINNQYTLFPNPVNQRTLNITGAEDISSVKFYNTTGEMVKSILTENQPIISLEINFDPGIYIVQLVNDKKSIIRKIVVN